MPTTRPRFYSDCNMHDFTRERQVQLQRHLQKLSLPCQVTANAATQASAHNGPIFAHYKGMPSSSIEHTRESYSQLGLPVPIPSDVSPKASLTSGPVFAYYPGIECSTSTTEEPQPGPYGYLALPVPADHTKVVHEPSNFEVKNGPDEPDFTYFSDPEAYFTETDVYYSEPEFYTDECMSDIHEPGADMIAPKTSTRQLYTAEDCKGTSNSALVPYSQHKLTTHPPETRAFHFKTVREARKRIIAAPALQKKMKDSSDVALQMAGIPRKYWQNK